ncbi:MAG: hypothetical protein ACR2MD_06725 [Aridibacter sp.]
MSSEFKLQFVATVSEAARLLTRCIEMPAKVSASLRWRKRQTKV